MSSMFTYIPDEAYDRHHDYFDSTGSIIESTHTTTALLPSIPSGARRFNSFYLSAALHYDITDDGLEDLPRRFEPGNVKAKFTWFGTLCLAGIGMFVEAYVIITTGQIKTVWHAAYPTCYEPNDNVVCPENIECCGLFPNTPTFENGTCAVNTALSGLCTEDGTYGDAALCDPGILAAQSYSSFAGIMLGMVSFGILADVIGRNSAGILTSLLMIVGISVMAFIRADEFNTMFLIWAISFGLFGLGVGGEYPLSATSAADYHNMALEEANLEDDERKRLRIMREREKTARRGETIGIVFAQQGVGAVCGSVFLLCLLYFSGNYRVDCNSHSRPGSNPAGVDSMALENVWRSFYFIGGIIVMMVLLYRYFLVNDSEHSTIQKRKECRSKKLTYFMIFKMYGLRLISTGGNWFVWDVTFYGLKLFSGPIFSDLNPTGDLLIQNGYLLLNNVIALSAYYVAAYAIDRPSIGRRKVQAFFFGVVSVIYFIMSFIFSQASSTLLLILFFMTSFFGQFVNTTTFVMAAESYPSELRGTFHGLSAFHGKLGALVATILLKNSIPQQYSLPVELWVWLVPC